MKRILLVTYGSYGDLHPFLGLTRALHSLGHQVTLATHAEYETAVRREGAAYLEIPPSLASLGPLEAWTARAHHLVHGPEFVIRDVIVPHVEPSYRRLLAAAPGQDLILTHSLAYGAAIAADKLGIPRLSIVLQPAILFSAGDPPVIAAVPALRHFALLGPAVYHWMVRTIARSVSHWVEPVQALRLREGLPRLAQSPVFTGQFSARGWLALFPAVLAAPQPDWPAAGQQIGFPFFDEDGSQNLSEGTANFLESGPAPVVFTLGSSVVMGRTPFFEIALATIERIGGRALFLYGRNPQGIPAAARHRADLHLAEYEPFSKLFPRAAVVVHQCGIGTTAQALRAGRPQVLVPFSHDQPDNARRVARLGCGRAVPSRSLTVARLARAIAAVRSDARYAEAARRAASTVNQGDFTENLRAALRATLGW